MILSGRIGKGSFAACGDGAMFRNRFLRGGNYRVGANFTVSCRIMPLLDRRLTPNILIQREKYFAFPMALSILLC